MQYAGWMMAALLATTPAQARAAEVEFQGQAIEVDGSADARQVLRVRGKRYSIPGTPAQVVGKAQMCLVRKDSGAGIASTDPAGGRLAAVVRVDYAAEPRSGTVKAWLAVEAGEHNFTVIISKLGTTQRSAGDDEEVFSPLLMRRDSGWELALAAVIKIEQALVECMYS